jgi:hypothetical protein
MTAFQLFKKRGDVADPATSRSPQEDDVTAPDSAVATK